MKKNNHHAKYEVVANQKRRKAVAVVLPFAFVFLAALGILINSVFFSESHAAEDIEVEYVSARTRTDERKQPDEEVPLVDETEQESKDNPTEKKESKTKVNQKTQTTPQTTQNDQPQPTDTLPVEPQTPAEDPAKLAAIKGRLAAERAVEISIAGQIESNISRCLSYAKTAAEKQKCQEYNGAPWNRETYVQGIISKYEEICRPYGGC